MAGSYPIILDLASSRYSGEAQSFYLAFARMQGDKKAGGVYLDGDFSKPEACGEPVPEHPFMDEGDRTATIIRQEYWQALNRFKPAALGSHHPSDGKFLLTDERDFRCVGGGMVVWTRVHATVPQDHDVFESFIHPYQYLETIRPFKLSDKPLTVLSRIRREFFLVAELSRNPALVADRIDLMSQDPVRFARRGQADWKIELAAFLTVHSKREIIAEDSTIQRWHYPIYERRTRYVPAPTLDLWGSNYTIPGLPT